MKMIDQQSQELDPAKRLAQVVAIQKQLELDAARPTMDIASTTSPVAPREEPGAPAQHLQLRPHAGGVAGQVVDGRRAGPLARRQAAGQGDAPCARHDGEVDRVHAGDLAGEGVDGVLRLLDGERVGVELREGVAPRLDQLDGAERVVTGMLRTPRIVSSL